MPPKRRLSSTEPRGAHKRLRTIHPHDALSPLSDELLIRILHHLPIATLLVTERISHRFATLANDSQLWKSLYYTRFVLPRARKIPGMRVSPATIHADGPPQFSSKKSKWLEDDALVNRSDGQITNWKRQYKLRHNWALGVCEVSEVPAGRKVRDPGLLVRLLRGLVITVDVESGLRAWNIKTGHVLATQQLPGRTPTSLAAHRGGISGGDQIYAAVGFADGSFIVWTVDTDAGRFTQVAHRARSGGAALDEIAYVHPYLLAITEEQVLSLYTCRVSSTDRKVPSPASLDRADKDSNDPTTMRCHLLTSLKSHAAGRPLSLSIRATSQTIVASVAYALPTYLSGWSVGLQELHLTLAGEIVQSRLTSAMDQSFHSLVPRRGCSSIGQSPLRITNTRPTSLSYAHPYLLSSHSDNTLTLYLVHSNANLTISKGTKLWGHTSSVSDAQVGGRGKAVSVSARGNELRVWELEGAGGASTRRRLNTRSVEVRPAASDDDVDLESRKGWVGFDEETVIVLKESTQGSQALMVYDFS